MLFIVGLICVITLTVFSTWQHSSNPNTDICFKYTNVKYDTLNINDIQAQYCYCSQESYTTLITTDKADSCGEYLKYKNLRVLILFIVGFINFSASRRVCNFMTTSDDYFLNIYKFKMRKNTTRNLTLLFILNFGLILVILNSRVLYPEARDFTRKWYLEVGSPLVSFFGMICLFSILHSLFTRIVKAISIKLKREIALLQTDLNKLMIGSKFYLEFRYAMNLALIYIAFTFAGGLPILLPILLVYLFVTYNIDKYLVINYYRKPEKIGPEIN